MRQENVLLLLDASLACCSVCEFFLPMGKQALFARFIAVAAMKAGCIESLDCVIK